MTEVSGNYQPAVSEWTGNPVEGIWHLDGIDWFKAPKPKPRHKCWAQTKGFVNGEWVFRCACGAIALDDPKFFTQKNANLDPSHTIYSGDYYPPGSRVKRWLLVALMWVVAAAVAGGSNYVLAVLFWPGVAGEGPTIIVGMVLGIACGCAAIIATARFLPTR